MPGEVAWPAVCGCELRVFKSERSRVRGRIIIRERSIIIGRYKQGRYKQGRYKQEETGLNKHVQKDPVAASFFLASWARATVRG